MKQNFRSELEGFLETICSISKAKYQDVTSCEMLDDIICNFFDDGEGIISNPKKFSVNAYQHQLLFLLHMKLRDFTDEFDVYSPDTNLRQVVQNPLWIEIQSLAERVLDAFHYN